MTHAPNLAPSPSSSAIDAMSELRRQFVAEAINGLLFQGDACVRFLERGADEPAEKCMARMFDFARTAATAMRELRSAPKLEG